MQLVNLAFLFINNCVWDYATHHARCDNVQMTVPALPSFVSDVSIYGGQFFYFNKDTFNTVSYATKITKLLIMNAHIKNVYQDAFDDLVYLKTLDLSNNVEISTAALKALLFSLRNSHLQRLRFHDNAGEQNWSVKVFSDAPQTLSEVDISINSPVQSCDGIFDGLEELSVLRLMSNQISRCSESFKQLESLNTLDISHNNIANFNTNTLPITLKDLNLSFNRLASIPDFCFLHGNSSVPSLESLNLNNNLIQNVENATLYCLTSLKRINLEHNFIEPGPYWYLTQSPLNINRDLKIFYFLPQNLNELYLGNNRLSRVPTFCLSNGTSYLPNLQTLDLEYNGLTLDHFKFDCLPSLNSLHLAKNFIAPSTSKTFDNLPRLINLDMSNIRYMYDDQTDYNAVFSLHQLPLLDEFRYPSLKHFNSSGNNFIPNLSKCSNLESVDFSERGTIPVLSLNASFLKKQLGHLPRLKVLNLRRCHLNEIPEGFFKSFPNLEKVFLSGNNISELQTGLFHENSKIKLLTLSDNIIKHIEFNTFPPAFSEHIEMLDLSGNPLKCECTLRWVKDEFKSSFEAFALQVSRGDTPLKQYICRLYSERNSLQLHNFNMTSYDCTPREPKSELLAVLASSLSVSAVVMLSALLAYKGRWHIRYWIYLLRYKRTNHNRIEDDNFRYDAFVIYTDEDRDFVHNTLLPKLENEAKLRLSVHFRDFQPGKMICDNIVECMGNSRMAIVMLSRYFCESRWCKFELTIAQDRWMNNESEALFLVMLEELHSKHMSKELRALIRTTTYALWTDDNQRQILFWDKILSTLLRL